MSIKQPRLIHSACGGALTIDPRTPQLLNDGPRDTTDIYRGVKCAECGEPLGLLANIDEDTYGPN